MENIFHFSLISGKYWLIWNRIIAYTGKYFRLDIDISGNNYPFYVI